MRCPPHKRSGFPHRQDEYVWPRNSNRPPPSRSGAIPIRTPGSRSSRLPSRAIRMSHHPQRRPSPSQFPPSIRLPWRPLSIVPHPRPSPQGLLHGRIVGPSPGRNRAGMLVLSPPATPASRDTSPGPTTVRTIGLITVRIIGVSREASPVPAASGSRSAPTEGPTIEPTIFRVPAPELKPAPRLHHRPPTTGPAVTAAGRTSEDHAISPEHVTDRALAIRAIHETSLPGATTWTTIAGGSASADGNAAAEA